MKLTSTVFDDKAKVPQEYVMAAAGGSNISIPLAWEHAPEGVKFFAISIVDHHPMASRWVHWLVIDIPANVTSLARGASQKNMPKGSLELKNSFGSAGYGGPQPPKGRGDHAYVITIYALNADSLSLGDSVTEAQFLKAIEGKVLGSAHITGYYGR
ncbi:MAG: YbhB/YbcL family Raf kinase inhibitor-like protein [Pseudomonadota bacterium]